MDYGATGTEESRQSSCLAANCDDIAQLKARDVMQYGVVTIDRREPVSKAVSLLLEKGISGLVVTDQGRLSGMLSERDLLKLMDKTEYLPGLVEDYATRNVTSFNVEDALTLICEHLAEGSFRHAPVLYQQKLAGMITRADLIRVYKERFRPPENASASVACGGVLAEDVMRHGLLTMHPETSLYDSMDMIARYRVTGLPVVDEAMHLLGMITEKDVLRYITHPTPAQATVGTIMTTKVIAFDRKATLDQICVCLIENDFHRVPILDHDRLVGIITRSDILRKRVAVFKLGTGRSENLAPRPAVATRGS